MTTTAEYGGLWDRCNNAAKRIGQMQLSSEGVSEDDILTFEKKFDVSFPLDARLVLEIHDGRRPGIPGIVSSGV